MPELVKPDLEALLTYYGADTTRLSPTGWSPRKIRCIVHDDRNPSMSVNLEEGKVHCWSCPAHGDVYDLIVLKESDVNDFVAAKRWAEDHLGFEGGQVSRAPAGRYRPSWSEEDD